MTSSAGGLVAQRRRPDRRPREIAVLDDGGHIAAYTDLCLVGGDSGGHGLVAQLATVGLDLGDFSATADDGCVTSAAVQAAATDVVHHFLTAGLRWHLGVDRLPVGLGLGVTAVLPASSKLQPPTLKCSDVCCSGGRSGVSARLESN